MQMNKDEVRLHISIAKLVNTLTLSQQKMLVNVFEQLTYLYVHRRDAVYTPISNIPTRKADLDRIYTRSSNSIMKNLPIPDCTMLGQHSFVSIIDCLADFLLMNTSSICDVTEFDEAINQKKIDSESSAYFDNEHVKHMRKKQKDRQAEFLSNLPYPILPFFLMFWSDDFDPNRGMKSNRQSVWIMTCTIRCLNQKGSMISTTYPISVAVKEADHEEVHQMMYEDIKKIKYR
jgi:hypothetical protein